MKKKIVALALTAILGASLLTGCGNSGTGGTVATDGSSSMEMSRIIELSTRCAN